MVFTAPGGSSFNSSRSFNSSGSSWYTVHPPQPTILRSFPEDTRDRGSITPDVAFFCQPDGCSVDLPEQRIHHFMLTDTETNRRTYGTCLSFPHLFDPPRRGTEGETCPVGSPESVCIQEWGVLSLCVLSHYPFFTFLHKALLSLHHFVEHFFGEDLTWNALIHGGVCEASGEGHRTVVEIEKWVGQLLSMRAPQQGQSALEVELEVDPAVSVSIPPANRLPLLDLSVCRLFQRLGVCCVLEIFKLVLGEQKVGMFRLYFVVPQPAVDPQFAHSRRASCVLYTLDAVNIGRLSVCVSVCVCFRPLCLAHTSITVLIVYEQCVCLQTHAKVGTTLASRVCCIAINIVWCFVCTYVCVAVPRQDSMSPYRANAVLSAYCNRFVGYP